MNGFLLVDKPKGMSSFGVVARVRGVWRAQLRAEGQSIKKAKVGHTGTLDPAASGLMILVLGEYCKRAMEFSKLDKVYEVNLRLGQNSTTDDGEGELEAVSDFQPTKEQLYEALSQFTGEIQQVPPIYSAIKVNGRRAYDMARKGQEVVLEPRSVTIFSLDNVDYSYPEVSFTVHVSSGTYIRSIVRDLGEKLGTGAYLQDLRRTKVGAYLIQDATSLEQLGTVNQIQSVLREA